MIALLAHPAILFALGNLKSDMKALWGWLCHRSFWQLVSMGLALFCGLQHFELVRAHHSAAKWEQQFKAEKSALDTTKANLLAAADRAKREDAANAERVKVEQSAINERSAHDFEARIAAARAAAERLQRTSAAHPGSGGTASMSGVPSSSGGTAQASGQDQLSTSDALTATEQAIQLDELISWIRRQHQVDPNKAAPHG